MPGILDIAVSGLNNAVLRVANAASNIVNASSTSKLPSTPSDPYTGFQPQDVVTLSSSTGGNNLGVTSALTPRSPAYVAEPNPNSADANAQGLVAAPNVDLNAELISSKEAEISYAADAKIISVTQKMQKSLLDAIS